MHRVELKVEKKSLKLKKVQEVPNAPCGVERVMTWQIWICLVLSS